MASTNCREDSEPGAIPKIDVVFHIEGKRTGGTIFTEGNDRQISVSNQFGNVKCEERSGRADRRITPVNVNHSISSTSVIAEILTEVGERKALNESDIYKFMVMKFKLGNDYAQIKTDLKQALKRLMIFGQIREIKGYGKWSTYQILEKKSECPPTTSTKLNNPIIHSIRSLSQSILSTGSLPTPTLIRPNTSTPLWDRTALRNVSLNGPLSSSLNASPIWGTPMPYHKSSNLGYRRQYDNDEVDEGIRKAAQLRKMKDTMHYLRV
ncbi:hypothetical protein Ddc_12797 [Ditylenchus destructor]|nr:hypothetical protein Ddc_12797 [Ditylenchus destructor]